MCGQIPVALQLIIITTHAHIHDTASASACDLLTATSTIILSGIYSVLPCESINYGLCFLAIY